MQGFASVANLSSSNVGGELGISNFMSDTPQNALSVSEREAIVFSLINR